MGIASRTTLKTYFERGDQPTEAQFIDLIDSSVNKSDDTIAGSVDDISSLLNISTNGLSGSEFVLVQGYYNRGDGGWDIKYWDATQSKANHNGGTIINPAHNSAIGSDNWYDPSGDGTSTGTNGCWVSVETESINVKRFGIEDSPTKRQQVGIQSILDYLEGGGGHIIIPAMTILIGSSDGSYKGFDIDNHDGLRISGVSKSKSIITNDYVDDSIIIFEISCASVVVERLSFTATATGAEDYFSKYAVLFRQGADGGELNNAIARNGLIFRIGEPGPSPQPETSQVTFGNIELYDANIAPLEINRCKDVNCSNFYVENCGGDHNSGSGYALTIDSVRNSNFDNFILKDSVGFKFIKDEQDAYDCSLSNFYIESPDESITLDRLVQFEQVSATTADLYLGGINVSNFNIIYSDQASPINIVDVNDINFVNVFIRPRDGYENKKITISGNSRNVYFNNLNAYKTWLDINEKARKVIIDDSTISSSAFNTAGISGIDIILSNTIFKQFDNSSINIDVDGSDVKFLGCTISGGNNSVITSGDKILFDNTTVSYSDLRGFVINSTDTVINDCYMTNCQSGWRQLQPYLRVSNSTVQFDSDTTPRSLASDISASEVEPVISVSATDVEFYDEHEFVTITDDDSSDWDTYITEINYINNEITLAGTSPSSFTQAQNATIQGRKRANQINDQDSTDARIYNNDFDSTLTFEFDSSDIIYYNRNFVTENKGTASITTGNTSITVSHGLDYTPYIEDISVILNSTLGSASYYYVDSVTSTQFTINVDTDPTQTVDFSWKASRNT